MTNEIASMNISSQDFAALPSTDDGVHKVYDLTNAHAVHAETVFVYAGKVYVAKADAQQA